MRNNIADALTFFRYPAAGVLFVLILNELWLPAMLVFIVAILSDAVDGIAARRWPPKERWYRKNPHVFDNGGDMLMFLAGMAGLVFAVRPLWLWVAAASVVGSIILVVLTNKMRPAIAEKADVLHGWCFGILLLAMLMQITSLALPSPQSAWLNGTFFAAAIWIVTAKWDRATSRPEVQYKGTW